MSNFYHAVSLLIEQIQTASPEVNRCTQHIDLPIEFNVIDWFQTQSVFPKFYWQSRDGEEEVIALGQLQQFTELGPAYSVICGEQRIWGGCSFDGGTEKNPQELPAFFFLPQIELIRQHQRWQLAANVNHSRPAVVNLLQQLTDSAPPLAAIDVAIRHMTQCPDVNQWRALIDGVLDGVSRHQFKKVVLARETSLELDGSLQAAQLLKASCQHNRDSFHFLLSFNEDHSVIGSPPERLYQRVDRTLYTEALAGTVGRGQDPEEDKAFADWLLHDDKNVNENQYVVDDIISHLTDYSDRIQVTPNAELVTLRKVHHLKRLIKSQLKAGINGCHLLAALHPTAAVAGLPREQAKAFIHQYEPFVRGWYAGAVGYISQRKAEFCVAIRSAQILNGQVKLYAGAGIVPGSEADAEWNELNKKVSTLLSLLVDNQEFAGDHL